MKNNLLGREKTPILQLGLHMNAIRIFTEFQRIVN